MFSHPIFTNFSFAVTLSFSIASHAETRNIEGLGIRAFDLPDYKISYNPNIVTLKMGFKKSVSLYSYLENTHDTHISFFSSTLGEPNKKECAELEMNNETITKKSTLFYRSTTVKISGIKDKDLKNAKDNNCIVVPITQVKEQLGIH